MRCPKCRVEMLEITGGVPVDHCLQCQGIWFDAGELEVMRTKALPSSSGKPTILVVVRDVPELLCPRCETASLELTRAYGFELEHCVDCHGLFLDRCDIDELKEQWRLRRQRATQHEPPDMTSPVWFLPDAVAQAIWVLLCL